MTEQNYVGAVTWYIVTAGEGVDIPGFVFSRDEAPYLIGQAHSGNIFVFARAAMLELIEKWHEANEEMKAQP